MKKIVIGGLAVLIGVAGASQFFFSTLGIILGALPIFLILGGALAFYLGFTDVQESKKENAQAEPEIHTESDQIQTSQELTVKEKTDTAQVQDQIQDASEDAVLETDTPLFKGNAETLVFHRITCKFSQGKKCTSEFATREEAMEQGYKPCKVCSP